MECYQPVQPYDLILSKWTLQQEGNFSENIRWLQISSDRLKSFCHFDSHVSQSRHLLVPCFFAHFVESCLRIVNLNLLTQLFLVGYWISKIIFVHTLLDETFGIKLLCYAHWKLQVFTYEAFQLFCTDLLAFLLNSDGVVVTSDFFDGLPKNLHHLAYVVGSTANFHLLIFKLLLLP